MRTSEELPKANEKRLREYADSAMPAVKQQLFSTAPIYDDLEIATLTFSLSKLREMLGPDDPVVRKVLGKDSPRELATAVVKGTKLKDVKLRKALFEGGKKAVDASDDPMIQLARKVDPDARDRAASRDRSDGREACHATAPTRGGPYRAAHPLVTTYRRSRTDDREPRRNRA